MMSWLRVQARSAWPLQHRCPLDTHMAKGCGPGTQASLWSPSPGATWAEDINTDPDCGWITGMVLSNRLDLDVTTAFGGSAGHSDPHSPHSIMALGP